MEKLTKMDIFIIGGVLRSEQKKEQAQLDQLKAQEQTPETAQKQLYYCWELEQITNILNKLKGF